MRSLLIVMFAFGFSHSAFAEGPPNTLTPEEARDGYVLLFDGKTLLDLTVEGDYEIKDGILVLGGGTQPTRVKFAKNPGRQYVLRFDFLAEGPINTTTLEVFKKSMFGQSMSSMGLPQSKGPAAWNGLTLKREVQKGDTEPKVTVKYDLGNGTLTDGEVSLTVAPGSKLSLRNIKLKTLEAESMLGLLSLYAVLLTIFLVVVGAPLTAYLWWRARRRTARPEPGPLT